jgi:hypothetical protein
MESLKKYAELSALSPAKILRNLENGFFMSHQEQTEAADYIRMLQESYRVLAEGMIRCTEELVAMRCDLHNATRVNDEQK